MPSRDSSCWTTNYTNRSVMIDTVQRPPRSHLSCCGWFWAWATVGTGAVLAAVSLGPLLLIPIALIASVMASRPNIRRSAFGLVSGAGILLLVVAYLQRQGPGTTCWHKGAASGCDEHLNPIPWLIVGIACVIGGIVGHVKRDA
jgi:hypothetical protein